MSLARSSALIAAGTLVSRVTGLIRTIVLVTAIGVIGPASDAFATANQLPNTLIAIISTGLLTGVIVPHVVALSARSDGGRAVLPKLMTLGATGLAIATALAMLAAPFLVWLFAANFSDEQRALAVAFAYWCIPQVFFLGMFALVGETLNARGVFAPYAWAPIANNVVSIAGFGVLIAIFGADRRQLEEWDLGSIALIGATATIGIIAQTLILAVFWRRTGIPLRPDFRWRGIGLRGLSRRASWTFSTMLIGVAAGIVQQQTISAASGTDASIFVWQNAWLIYMLPYSLIVLSIGTPYFTRISEHAAAGRNRQLVSDIDQSIRMLTIFVLVAVAGLVAAAAPATRVFSNSTTDALASAPVLIAFLVGLTPMAVLFIVQRTFYAYGDTRTPFWFTLVQGVLVVVFTLSAAAVVANESLTASVAAGQTVAGLFQVTVAAVLLRRMIGPFGLGRTLVALGRFVCAAALAASAGFGVYMLSGGAEGWMLTDKLTGALGTVLIGAASLIVYLAVLAALRTRELSLAFAAVRQRLGH